MRNNRKSGNVTGGIILIVLGIILTFNTIFDINLFSYIKNIWPLGLVALGVYIILKDKGGFDDYNSPKQNEGNADNGTQF